MRLRILRSFSFSIPKIASTLKHSQLNAMIYEMILIFIYGMVAERSAVFNNAETTQNPEIFIFVKTQSCQKYFGLEIYDCVNKKLFLLKHFCGTIFTFEKQINIEKHNWNIAQLQGCTKMSPRAFTTVTARPTIYFIIDNYYSVAQWHSILSCALMAFIP